MALASAKTIKEGKTISTDPMDHDDRRRAFCELDQMHDKEFENGILSASNGLNEGNDGGYISRVMNTS